MKAQIEANRAETERYIATIEALRSELEESRNVRLKAALANEANVENERDAKQEALRERYAECISVGVQVLVG